MAASEDPQLITLRPERVLTPQGWLADTEVVLRGERIVAVRTAQGPVNLPGRGLLPGFVNAHSHAFQRGLRGHVQWRKGTDDFWSWREKMYALANGLSPEGVEAVSALAFLEMVKAGFTAVGEFHYLHYQPDGRPYADPDELARRVLAAAESAGIRIRLLRVVYGRAGHGLPPNPLQRRFIDHSPEHALRAAERLGAGLAPHSVRALPLSWMKELATFSGVVHAHVAEQPREIEACRAEHGCGPLELFGRAGLLSSRFTAVHLTWPQGGDRERMLESGARACVCPTTELDLGDGFYHVDQLAGVPMCIGTDSHAQIDPFAELRALELHSRALQGRRNVLAPPDEPDGLALRLLGIGAREGAMALDFDAGEITEGRLADLVGVDLEDLALVGARPLPVLVFAGGRVREAWVGGRRVLQDGEHPAEAGIRAAALRHLG